MLWSADLHRVYDIPAGGTTSDAVRLASALQECLDLPVTEDQMVFTVGTADSLSDIGVALRQSFTYELTAGKPRSIDIEPCFLNQSTPEVWGWLGLLLACGQQHQAKHSLLQSICASKKLQLLQSLKEAGSRDFIFESQNNYILEACFKIQEQSVMHFSCNCTLHGWFKTK